MKGHIMIKSLNPKASDNVLIKKTEMGCLTAFDKGPVEIVKTSAS